MANVKQAGARRLKMAERAQTQMNILFPGFPAAWLWRRKTNHGFCTIPRTLPIAMQAIDNHSKGTPAGHVLFCLWSRAPDHELITIEHPATFAAEAGFTGERAVDTWRRRMKALRELSFIMTKDGPSGEFHYVLLLNPNVAVEWMRHQNRVQDDLYTRFRARIDEVGAFGDIDAYHAYCAAEELARQAAAQNIVPPPPPPAADGQSVS